MIELHLKLMFLVYFTLKYISLDFFEYSFKVKMSFIDLLLVLYLLFLNHSCEKFNG